MITLEDVENLVSKFPELELKQQDHWGKIHYCCVMKESPDFEVFDFNEDNVVGNHHIFLNLDTPFRVNAEKSQIYYIQGGSRYGLNYNNLNDLEKPLKKVVFMLDNLLLLQKKMKMYEKKLNLETDFKE